MTQDSDTEEIRNEIRSLSARLRILEHRLVPNPATRDFTPETYPALVALVNDERIGIPAAKIDEVILLCELSPIPESPVWMAGMLNFHGELLPVIDVAARFQQSGREPALSDLIIIVRTNSFRMGLVVTGIMSLIEVKTSEIQEVPWEIPQAAYLLGVYEQKEKIVMLIDLTAIYSSSLPPSLENDQREKMP